MNVKGVPEIPVLFEDEDIIVVNKPSQMLSVPGKSSLPRQPRHIEWRNAIQHAAKNEKYIMSDECRDALQILCSRTAKSDNIPRKQQPFEKCVKKILKANDKPDLISEIWTAINKSDELQHKVSFDDIPPHRVSVIEAIEHHQSLDHGTTLDTSSRILCPKILAPHRLDCETSGVLLLAKTEDAAGAMGHQFREKAVSMSIS